MGHQHAGGHAADTAGHRRDGVHDGLHLVKHGVPEVWVTALRKAGINTLAQLKEANVNKLFNDLGGLRKKLKLDVPAIQKEEVEKWING